MDEFGIWWDIFKDKTKEERLVNYNSLSDDKQIKLRQSFIYDGWCYLFCQNHIDRCLDIIKDRYDIDLIDLRIKAIKFNKVFLIDRFDWELIEDMIIEYEPLFNSEIIFGGLKVRPWGKQKQFVVVSAVRQETK